MRFSNDLSTAFVNTRSYYVMIFVVLGISSKVAFKFTSSAIERNQRKLIKQSM